MVWIVVAILPFLLIETTPDGSNVARCVQKLTFMLPLPLFRWYSRVGLESMSPETINLGILPPQRSTDLEVHNKTSVLESVRCSQDRWLFALKNRRSRKPFLRYVAQNFRRGSLS